MQLELLKERMEINQSIFGEAEAYTDRRLAKLRWQHAVMLTKQDVQQNSMPSMSQYDGLNNMLNKVNCFHIAPNMIFNHLLSKK